MIVLVLDYMSLIGPLDRPNYGEAWAIWPTGTQPLKLLTVGEGLNFSFFSMSVGHASRPSSQSTMSAPVPNWPPLAVSHGLNGATVNHCLVFSLSIHVIWPFSFFFQISLFPLHTFELLSHPLLFGFSYVFFTSSVASYVFITSAAYSFLLSTSQLLLMAKRRGCFSFRGEIFFLFPLLFGLSLLVDPRILVVGSLSNESSGSSNPCDMVANNSSTQGNEPQRYATLVAKEDFPFKVLLREAEESDSSGGLPSWIDPSVVKVYSTYTYPESLVGMADAICRFGLWSVELGIKLPFTDFERAVLQVLNIAPTQLHPNSWAFVQVFELLRKDMVKEPSLNVEKVSWTSLSSRPRRRLKKPLYESYKFFKDHFFRVAPDSSRPSLLFEKSGNPLFPLYWTDQPAVPITVDRVDLEDWEKDFSAKELMALKKRDSRSPTAIVAGAIVKAIPLVAAWLEPSQLTKEKALPPPVVALDSLNGSLRRADVDVGGSIAKRLAKEGALESQ
ncbi:hypothetical protein CR513_42827, partial [Mucuna pruriens]